MSPLFQKYKILIFAFILYFPFIFLGYGTDNDTFSLLDHAKLSFQTGDYFPSRHPGYIVHEAATLLLSSVGGSVLSNSGTVAMALLMIAGFLRICRYFSIPNSNYLAILLIAHPLILVNATETIDYLWAAGLIFFGFALLLDDRYFLAGILLGLSIGARLSSFIAAGAILAYALFYRKECDKIKDRQKALLAILITGIIGVLCYIPSLMYSHWTMEVFKPHMPDNEAWSFKSRLGKAVYKNIYFWGLPASVLFGCILHTSIKNRKEFMQEQWFVLTLLSVAVIAGYEILFLKFPIQVEYLIPTLPFCLFLIGITLHNKPRVLVAFTIAVISFNFVNLNFAKANISRQATGAKLGLWVEEGLLIREIKGRNDLRDCINSDCWARKFETFINER